MSAGFSAVRLPGIRVSVVNELRSIDLDQPLADRLTDAFLAQSRSTLAADRFVDLFLHGFLRGAVLRLE